MLAINLEINQDVTTLILSGRIDSVTVVELENKLEQLDLASTRLMIDLSDVDFISSRGLWTLIELRKTVSEKDGAMVLVGLSSDLDELLSTVGFSHLFNILPGREDGLEYLVSAELPGDPTTDAPPPRDSGDLDINA